MGWRTFDSFLALLVLSCAQNGPESENVLLAKVAHNSPGGLRIVTVLPLLSALLRSAGRE